MVADQLGKASERLDSDHRRLCVSNALTLSRVEHPTRYGDLQPVGQPDHGAGFRLAAHGADDLYFLAEERMVGVVDSGQTQCMSSVMMRCAMPSPPT